MLDENNNKCMLIKSVKIFILELHGKNEKEAQLGAFNLYI